MQASSDTFAISHYYADIRGLFNLFVMVIASARGFTMRLMFWFHLIRYNVK